MDFYNVFRSFLGIPNSALPEDFNSERYDKIKQDRHDNLFRSQQDEGQMGLQIFSNLIDMQLFFNQQMDEMMRFFSVLGDDSLSINLFGDQNVSETQNLRDKYLKHGYEESTSLKIDCDIDGKVDINEIDIILNPKYNNLTIKSNFIITTRIVKPDGTVETTITTRDSAGNEEINVNCKNGNHEYMIITRIDKEGKEEKHEKLINIKSDQDHLVPKPLFDNSSFINIFNISRFFK